MHAAWVWGMAWCKGTVLARTDIPSLLPALPCPALLVHTVPHNQAGTCRDMFVPVLDLTCTAVCPALDLQFHTVKQAAAEPSAVVMARTRLHPFPTSS